MAAAAERETRNGMRVTRVACFMMNCLCVGVLFWVYVDGFGPEYAENDMD